IDLRRSIDGLAALVRERFTLDPLSGHLFLFRNRRGDRIKILAWVWSANIPSARNSSRNSIMARSQRMSMTCPSFAVMPNGCSHRQLGVPQTGRLLAGSEQSVNNSFPNTSENHIPRLR